MCTLIVLHRCVPGAPLVVVANRDEFYQRPAEPPKLRRAPFGAFLAPRDTRAGGTWFGLNASGVFAAVTNQRCLRPDPDRRSRGLLVTEALGAGSAREAADALAGLDPAVYNPFNLVLADRREAFVVACGRKVRRLELAPGPHVIGNLDPEDASSPKTARLRSEVADAAALPANQLEQALTELCRSHTGAAPLESTCVHADDLGYGTRSSFLLRLSASGDACVFRYADGAPCETEYEDFTPLLNALVRGAGDTAGDHAPRRAS